MLYIVMVLVGLFFIGIIIRMFYKDYKEDKEMEIRIKNLREERAKKGKTDKEEMFSQAYLAGMLTRDK